MNMNLFLNDSGNSSNVQDEAHKKIVLNIGGTRHETLKSTLRKIPATRLSKLCENPLSYDAQKNEYFFDRHPDVFSQILNYYRTGKLHYPTDVCGPLFEEELRFWDLDSTQVEPCCWMTYTRHRDAEETRNILEAQKIDGYDEFDEEEQREFYAKFGVTADELQESRYKFKVIQIEIWRLFNQPQHSKLAKVVNYITVMCIIISICTFCASTHHLFSDGEQSHAHKENNPHPQPSSHHTSSSISAHSENSNENNFTDTAVGSSQDSSVSSGGISSSYLMYAECLCNAWFTFELVVRFIVSPTKTRFIREGVNIIDFLATANFYVGVIQEWFLDEYVVSGDILDLLSIVRIFRIFKLTRHHPGLKILQLTLKASAGELLLLILFLIFGVVIFSAMVYFAEKIADSREKCSDLEDNANSRDYDSCTKTKSIIDWFWWSVVTMTTVGYGDMVPKSYSGMLVGMLCALAGVLTTSLPIPVIVSNFTIFYQHMEARKKLPKNIKRKIAPATMPLKGKTHEKLEQVKQRGRRPATFQLNRMHTITRQFAVDSSTFSRKVPNLRNLKTKGQSKSSAILPNDYSALSKPTFQSMVVSGPADEEAPPTPTTSADPLQDSIKAFLKQMEAGKKASGNNSEDEDEIDRQLSEESDSLLRRSTVVNVAGQTHLYAGSPKKRKRMSVSELLPKFHKREEKPKINNTNPLFKSTNFLQMERTSRRDVSDSSQQATPNFDNPRTKMYHQKTLEVPVEKGKRSKSMSISSIYSMHSNNDWISFQERSKEFKLSRQSPDGAEPHGSKPRRFSSTNSHSNSNPVAPVRTRMFLKRPGMFTAGNKYKRHSLQPVKLLNSSSSRPQSIIEDEMSASDPFRASSSTVLAQITPTSTSSRRHKDSFDTTTNSMSERDDSLDDLTSIPSVLSVDDVALSPQDLKLRSSSIDATSMGLKRSNPAGRKLNIHQFPNSHSFYNTGQSQSRSNSARKTVPERPSFDGSFLGNGDHILSRASSNSSLASQFLNQETVLKDVNSKDYSSVNLSQKPSLPSQLSRKNSTKLTDDASSDTLSPKYTLQNGLAATSPRSPAKTPNIIETPRVSVTDDASCSDSEQGNNLPLPSNSAKRREEFIRSKSDYPSFY